MEDALANAENEDMIVINLMDILGAVKEEEIVEGMEHSYDHDEAHVEDHDTHDEHIWLSLKNAGEICSYIGQQLGAVDSDHKAVYLANTESYVARLKELDAEYQSAVDSASYDTLLFADRFPFRYLVDDYDISYFAAFSGCSAETEASFETIAFLAGKMEELNLFHVMVIEGADHSIANTVIQNIATKEQSILEINSMQSITSGNVESGATYLSIMESNLEVLKEALKGKE